jgi:hypothetical protein
MAEYNITECYLRRDVAVCSLTSHCSAAALSEKQDVVDCVPDRCIKVPYGVLHTVVTTLRLRVGVKLWSMYLNLDSVIVPPQYSIHLCII